MADNVSVRQGTGSNVKSIASDEVGGVHYQRIKISSGEDGVANDVSPTNPFPVLTDLATPVGAVGETAPASDIAASGLNGRLQRIAQRLTSLMALLPASVGGGGGLITEPTRTATGTTTAVASSASSQQILAANANRKGLLLVNTDVNAVLIKFGTTASSSSFGIRLVQYGQYEMAPPIYTGRIDAIWEADGSGSLYATEL